MVHWAFQGREGRGGQRAFPMAVLQAPRPQPGSSAKTLQDREWVRGVPWGTCPNRQRLKFHAAVPPKGLFAAAAPQPVSGVECVVCGENHPQVAESDEMGKQVGEEVCGYEQLCLALPINHQS
jgi:hypothetical protein